MLAIFCGSGYAQAKKTYVYLEVNKNLPVTIKLNNTPVKNERKGYVLITNLQAGSNVLSFDFANPDFKPHEFVLENTGEKSMGLKLARVSDNKFVLQDVVSKKIINDKNTIGTNPIALQENQRAETVTSTKKKIQKNKTETVVLKETKSKPLAKKENKQEAVVQIEKKVAKEKKVVTVAETKTQNRIEKSVVATTKTNDEPGRTYAMYQKRNTNTDNSKRYKNYGKARRAARRATRQLAKENTTATKPTIQAKVPKAQKNESTIATNSTNDKQVKKEARQQRREARQQEMLAKEKEENARVEKEQADKEAQREKIKQEKLQLKKQAKENNDTQNKEALKKERAETDNVVVTERTAKKSETTQVAPKKKTNNLGIEEKIINAEPAGNNSRSVKVATEPAGANNTIAARCTNSVRTERVADWTLRLHKKYDDEAREKYIAKKLGDKCISSNNLSVLLSNMDTQIGRYKLIRTLYPQLEDPTDLDEFYKFFPSPSYIAKLKELGTEVGN